MRRDPGWLLSYDVYGRGLAGARTLALGSTLRRFGRFGAVELTGVSHAGDRWVGYDRLETRWTYSDPRRMWTWTAGDFISGGLVWTTPVRLAGLQWRRNFGVRPDLITLPMPQFQGEATVPASLELYVNNIRQFSGEIQDGPFVIDVLPRISGSGHASLIVTDALGRVTRATLPLYVDHERLAPGLTDFSLEAGVLRFGYAGEGDEYGRDLVASGSIRRGMTNTLTLEAHGEAGPGVRLLGIGTVWSPANRWGVVSASYARGHGRRHGSQYALGYQWNAARYGFDVQLIRRSRGFRDLGDLSRDTATSARRPRSYGRATFWLGIWRGGLSLTWLRWRDVDGLDQDIRSVSWTQNIGRRLSVSATFFDDRHSGRGGGLTLSLPLGDRLQAGAGVQHRPGRTSPVASLRRNAPYDGGWGWAVQAGNGSGGYAQAEAQVRGRLGEVSLGVDRIGKDNGTFLFASGSAVWMGGQLFLSRRIYDSFAVVSTRGTAGVPILIENRRYGRTRAGGFLLVPDLRGWQRNRIGIDPDDLPPDYLVGTLNKAATPADRAGVLLHFNIADLNPAVLTVLGPAGEFLPAGSRGRIVGSDADVVVGFDGEVYIEDLSADIVIELTVDDALCRYHVPAPARPAVGPLRLGPFRCERVEP